MPGSSPPTRFSAPGCRMPPGVDLSERGDRVVRSRREQTGRPWVAVAMSPARLTLVALATSALTPLLVGSATAQTPTLTDLGVRSTAAGATTYVFGRISDDGSVAAV